jgi:hypothetical protein
MLAIDSSDGSETAKPKPTTADNPTAMPTADFYVFLKRLVSTGAVTCLATAAGLAFGASNFGGLGFGQRSSPSLVIIEPRCTSSLRLMSNFPYLLTIVNKNLLILLE